MPRKEDRIDLSGLYPSLTPAKLEEAKANPTTYVELITRISERHLGESAKPAK